MRYALLIAYDETTDAAMSPEEGQAQMAAYMAFQEKAGSAILSRRAPARDQRRHHRPRPQRRGPHLRRPLRRDQGADRRLLPGRGQGPRRGHRHRVQDPRCPARLDRSEAGLGDVAARPVLMSRRRSPPRSATTGARSSPRSSG